MVKNMKVEKFEKFPNQEQARFLITSVVTVKVINRMRAMDTFGRFSTKNVLTLCFACSLRPGVVLARAAGGLWLSADRPWGILISALVYAASPLSVSQRWSFNPIACFLNFKLIPPIMVDKFKKLIKAG